MRKGLLPKETLKDVFVCVRVSYYKFLFRLWKKTANSVWFGDGCGDIHVVNLLILQVVVKDAYLNITAPTKVTKKCQENVFITKDPLFSIFNTAPVDFQHNMNFTHKDLKADKREVKYCFLICNTQISAERHSKCYCCSIRFALSCHAYTWERQSPTGNIYVTKNG